MHFIFAEEKSWEKLRPHSWENAWFGHFSSISLICLERNLKKEFETTKRMKIITLKAVGLTLLFLTNLHSQILRLKVLKVTSSPNSVTHCYMIMQKSFKHSIPKVPYLKTATNTIFHAHSGVFCNLKQKEIVHITVPWKVLVVYECKLLSLFCKRYVLYEEEMKLNMVIPRKSDKINWFWKRKRGGSEWERMRERENLVWTTFFMFHSINKLESTCTVFLFLYRALYFHVLSIVLLYLSSFIKSLQ